MLESKVRTVDGEENVNAYLVNEYYPKKVNFSIFQRNKKRNYYCDEYACLDTETSHMGLEVGWVYQWAFLFNGDYIIGRTPSELIELLTKIKNAYRLREDKKIIIYIHNASYDLQYLKRHLYEYDPEMRMLAIDSHSVLICDILGFRILCSYKLSNMSLDMFSNNYAAKFRKAVGEIDYTVVRYQDEDLTESDWHYMLSDVASQHDAIRGYLESQGYDKAYKAPFTSTGFVRNDCRRASERDRTWRKEFLKSNLSLDQYLLCRQAFMGGITIASYQYAGEIMENVGHKDFTSSYPARQMMDYFPVGKPTWYGELESLEELERCLSRFCCIFLLTLENVQIKEGITAPYIPSSKCIRLKGDLRINGKIVYADMLTIAVTEIDYKWIRRQYTADSMKVSNLLIMKRGEAPAWLKSQVMKYYEGKCTLKHSDPKLYMASKALLNGIYGMSATSIIRQEYDLTPECIIERKKDQDDEHTILKYYRSYNSFMPYQLGVYTTAHARDALMQMIEAVGYDNFIYCDTDSVFYRKTQEAEENLMKMNAAIKQRAIDKGAYIGENYLGVATDEAPIKRFKALHSKCYACEELEKDGSYSLHVTIAGIPKSSIKWVNGKPVRRTNAEELGELEKLEDGFTFSHCGGTRCVYSEHEMTVGMINGHRTEYASAAIIENIEKTISDTMFTVGKDYALLHISQRQVLA